MNKLLILDYGTGNVQSITRALEKIGFQWEFSNERDRILEAPGIILPGVGSARQAMNSLIENNLVGLLTDLAFTKKLRYLEYVLECRS